MRCLEKYVQHLEHQWAVLRTVTACFLLSFCEALARALAHYASHLCHKLSPRQGRIVSLSKQGRMIYLLSGKPIPGLQEKYFKLKN